MEITGYKLRAAIQNWTLIRETAVSQFKGSLRKFKGEDKYPPDVVMKDIREAEEFVARLQTAQARYNLDVMIDVEDARMSLCQAVKMIGGAGRIANLWKDATHEGGTRDMFGKHTFHRDKDDEYAERTITVEDALRGASEAQQFFTALRAAVAQGNAEKRDIEGLTPELF